MEPTTYPITVHITERKSRKRSFTGEEELGSRKKAAPRGAAGPGRNLRVRPSQAGAEQGPLSPEQKPTYIGEEQNTGGRSGGVKQVRPSQAGAEQGPLSSEQKPTYIGEEQNTGGRSGGVKQVRPSQAGAEQGPLSSEQKPTYIGEEQNTGGRSGQPTVNGLGGNPETNDGYHHGRQRAGMADSKDPELLVKKELQDSLDEANKKAREMRRVNREREGKIRKMQGELREKEKTQSKLVAELETVKRQNKELERALIEKSKETQRESQEREGRIRKMEGGSWEMEKTESRLVAELETVKQGDKERGRALVKSNGEGISKIQRKNRENEGKIRKMEGELREMEKTESNLVAELETVKRENKERERTLIEKSKEIQRESQQRKERILDMEVELRWSKECEGEMVAGLRESLGSARALVTSKEEDINKIKRESQERGERLRETEGKLWEVEGKLWEVEGKLREMEGKLRRTKESESKLVAKLGQKEAERAFTEKRNEDITKIRRENLELTTQLDTVKKTENKLKQDLKDAQKKLRSEMEPKGRMIRATLDAATYQTGGTGLVTRREEVGQRASVDEVNTQMDMLNMGFEKMELDL